MVTAAQGVDELALFRTNTRERAPLLWDALAHLPLRGLRLRSGPQSPMPPGAWRGALPEAGRHQLERLWVEDASGAAPDRSHPATSIELPALRELGLHLRLTPSLWGACLELLERTPQLESLELHHVHAAGRASRSQRPRLLELLEALAPLEQLRHLEILDLHATPDELGACLTQLPSTLQTLHWELDGALARPLRDALVEEPGLRLPPRVSISLRHARRDQAHDVRLAMREAGARDVRLEAHPRPRWVDRFAWVHQRPRRWWSPAP